MSEIENDHMTEEELLRHQLHRDLLAETRRLSKALKSRWRWHRAVKSPGGSVLGFYSDSLKGKVQCWPIPGTPYWIDKQSRLFTRENPFVPNDPEPVWKLVYSSDLLDKKPATIIEAIRTMRENLYK